MCTPAENTVYIYRQLPDSTPDLGCSGGDSQRTLAVPGKFLINHITNSVLAELNVHVGAQ